MRHPAASSVSVVVPAFNAAAFLGETLDSVFAQTVRPLEVIVVDDGSADATREVARAYGSRVRVLERRQGGAAAARNTGAAAARGDWLAFVDADDVWLPEKLERQLETAGEACAMVYCDRYNIGVRAGLPERQSVIQPLVEGDVFVDLLVNGNVITTSGVLVRTAVFREAGGFNEDPRLLPAEDWDLWIRIAMRHEIRACREPLVKYRLHEAGASRRLEAMLSARRLIVSSALASPRGRALNAMTRRRIWAEAWRTNGWDAARHGARTASLTAYGRSAMWWPFAPSTYLGMARAVLGRG